jgi:hypothetical protein
VLIQIFDLIVSGIVPFMDFQCTELIMPSCAVLHDSARSEHLHRLLLVSAYVFVFCSKARRWSKQLDFEIGFREANTAFVLEVTKSESEDTFAGLYGVCSTGVSILFIFFFFSNTKKSYVCHYIKKKKKNLKLSCMFKKKEQIK